MNTAIILFSFIFAIVFDAVADSRQYYYDTKKEKKYMFQRHLFQSFMVLSFLLLLLTEKTDLLNFCYYLGTYILLRFALFDIVYNVTSGRNTMYIGENSIYDKILSKIFKSGTAKAFLMFLRMCSLIEGVYLIQRVLPI